ncbi:hypothetical protein [Bradyrhizobium sp. LB13.1]
MLKSEIGTYAPSGPSGEDVGTCLAIALTTFPQATRQVFVPSETAPLASKSAKYKAILLPPVADLPTYKENWGIDEVAIDWQAVEISEGRTTVRTAEVPANIFSGPAPYSLWQLHC